ncbi:MAG: helix-turn-helix transcriptional regulator [Woeseiaceae bacterium]|nr:helix-turn-helix transcriptional regulator [Woeseiaceae bacterium]
MRGKAPPKQRSGCPISIALEIFGDSWSLLVVRDLMFKQRRTFNEFLSAEENIATNILSERLARLESNEIIEKHQDPNDARRYIYRLTEKGIALAPVLVEMILWSAQHETTAAAPDVVAEMTAHKGRFLLRVRQEWARIKLP